MNVKLIDKQNFTFLKAVLKNSLRKHYIVSVSYLIVPFYLPQCMQGIQINPAEKQIQHRHSAKVGGHSSQKAVPESKWSPAWAVVSHPRKCEPCHGNKWSFFALQLWSINE